MERAGPHCTDSESSGPQLRAIDCQVKPYSTTAHHQMRWQIGGNLYPYQEEAAVALAGISHSNCLKC